MEGPMNFFPGPRLSTKCSDGTAKMTGTVTEVCLWVPREAVAVIQPWAPPVEFQPPGHIWML